MTRLEELEKAIKEGNKAQEELKNYNEEKNIIEQHEHIVSNLKKSTFDFISVPISCNNVMEVGVLPKYKERIKTIFLQMEEERYESAVLKTSEYEK